MTTRRSTGLDATQVLKKPLVTEKSTFRMNELGQYTFAVDRRASKGEIKAAVEKVYGVNVVSVNTMTDKGRYRRLRYGEVKLPDVKKAVVRLKEGQKIELF